MYLITYLQDFPTLLRTLDDILNAKYKAVECFMEPGL